MIAPMSDGLHPFPEQDLEALRRRMGQAHLRQRLALEGEQSAGLPRKGMRLLDIENWFNLQPLVRNALAISGLAARGERNTRRFVVTRSDVPVARLPRAFEGFTLLHLSDLHIDVSPSFVDHLVDAVRGLKADACVLTGDYRFTVRGPLQPTIDALARLREHLPADAYAVLGNHDSIRMVQPLEAMGIRVLLNESIRIEKDAAALHLAGIDDAHFFRAHNVHQAAQGIPDGGCSILLSHTPEPFRLAAQCGFGLMLCGHTHGGQICLPGGIPVLTDSNTPRALASGAWRHMDMHGYTSRGCGSSIVPARFNCPPEIALHRLVRRGA